MASAVPDGVPPWARLDESQVGVFARLATVEPCLSAILKYLEMRDCVTLIRVSKRMMHFLFGVSPPFAEHVAHGVRVMRNLGVLDPSGERRRTGQLFALKLRPIFPVVFTSHGYGGAHPNLKGALNVAEELTDEDAYDMHSEMWFLAKECHMWCEVVQVNPYEHGVHGIFERGTICVIRRYGVILAKQRRSIITFTASANRLKLDGKPDTELASEEYFISGIFLHTSSMGKTGVEDTGTQTHYSELVHVLDYVSASKNDILHK